MDRRSRRSFLRLLAGAVVALSAGPGLFTGRVTAASVSPVAAGPSAPGLRLWMGRGCSATASAIEAVGQPANLPYNVDFHKTWAVVASGVDRDTIDLSGSTINSTAGSSWVLVTAPRSLDQLVLSAGGTMVPAPAEGG